MKIYILFILFSYLHISVSKHEEKIKELKYTLKNSLFSHPKDHNLKNFHKYKNKSHKNNLDKNAILELEQNCIIKSISLKTVTNNKNDYFFGLFEGSNDISFSDSTPIAIIKNSLNTKRKNYIEIDTQISYKYIRYVPPNENNAGITELKLYGYKQSSKTKLQNLNEDNYYQVTNLPLITINTEEEEEPRMDEDINCHIKLINEGKLEINENAKIKVRGHSTSFTPKQPYRIKFSTKKKMFDFYGKEKKWNLIANYYDRSVLRNALAFKISELMKFDFTPRCQAVDVIINSNFRGNYYLCDKIEVGENRVNITEMKADDTSEPNISGGYFLKIDGWAMFTTGGNNFKTDKGIVGSIEYPEEDEITSEQKAYIISQLNKLESEIYNNNLDSIDLNSYSKFFLIKEFCGDPDHVWSSFYFTKDRNDNLFRFGPPWDFDLAFDNDNRLFPTNNKTEFCFNYCGSAGTTNEFVKTLIGNKKVIEYIRKMWLELCGSALSQTVLLDFIEEQRKYLKESADLNFYRWHIEEEIDFGRNDKSFDEAVEVIKDYIKERFGSLTMVINKAYYN